MEDSLSYLSGNVVGTETGTSSLLEPAREFKEFEMWQMRDRKAAVEKAFVKRVGFFVFGCLNARCNGTLYLGIGDSTKGEHYDGCVVGVRLRENDRTFLQEVMSDHFFGRDPASMRGVDAESRAAVQNCLKPARFVPIVGGSIGRRREEKEEEEDGELYVVEVDVAPRAAVCKDIKFYMNVRKEQTPSAKGSLSRWRTRGGIFSGKAPPPTSTRSTSYLNSNERWKQLSEGGTRKRRRRNRSR